jgi:hypothetical protein
MTWKLGGNRIYVEKDSGWIPIPRKGQIDLLDTSYSILHTAGRESLKREITFVVFSGYESNILPLVDDTSVSFEDGDGDTYTVSIMDKPNVSRVYNYRDSFDGTKVYRISMQLMLDEE